MATRLTAGVLQGTKHEEQFAFDWGGEEYTVEVHPLSNKQAADVEALSQQGMGVKANAMGNGKMHRSMSVDMNKMVHGRSQSDVLAVALGTSDESLTEEVVGSEFPPGVVRQIADRVRTITGMDNPDDEERSAIEEASEQDEEFPEGG